MRFRFIIGALLLLSPAVGVASQTPCVNIYFDRMTVDGYWMGKTYASMIQNLLGHFPHYQQIVSPIEDYVAGEIERCHATLYVGSHFFNKVPDTFVSDYSQTQKRVAWIGYNIWQTGDVFKNIFGYEYVEQTSLDYQNKNSKGEPGFYKDILYKGETFFKYGKVNAAGDFLAGFEQSYLVASQEDRGTQVLAYAQHSTTGQKIPYILQNKNFFYVSDVPFSFMHEADRYLVFADVLFDILNEKPRHDGKYALIRLEDVHANMRLPHLYKITDVFKKHQVPINISLIPIYYDPLSEGKSGLQEELMPMDRSPSFMSFIKDMKAANAHFIWHGVTHQYKHMRNPHDGLSGSDFEFFDAVNNRPIQEDSVDFVLGRLDEGMEVLKRAGIDNILMWLTPHYQASSLDYVIFGQVFPWNIGRIIHYNHVVKGLSQRLPPALSYDNNYTREQAQIRRAHFAQLQVQYENMIWSGQIFPYEIYGDIHGQRLIPENLGNSQPFTNAHVVQPRSKEEIIADAKRNLVLRDVWGSLFYHPFLLEKYEDGGRAAFPGDASELEYIIVEMKKLGYQFIDMKDYLNKNKTEIRPQPIYKEELK